MTDLQREWKQILAEHSNFILRSSNLTDEVPKEVRKAGWCGQPPASDEAIAQAENRLEKELPPSYREFLKVANGWRVFDSFIPRLWSCEEINWYGILHPDWAAAHLEHWI